MIASSLSFQNYAPIVQRLLVMLICRYVSGPILQFICYLIGSASLRALALGAQVDLKD